LGKSARKKSRVSVKEMKFRNDPMIRLYEKTQDWLQERGRPVVIAVGIIAGLVLLYTAGYYFFQYRESKAASAYTRALEKFRAPVSDTPDPSGKSYTDEKVKWQETASAFAQVAKDYPGYYGTIGRYYEGLAYLHLDRERGLQTLQEIVSKNDQPTSDLAKLALAENHSANGETDKAIPLYEELTASRFVPTEAVRLELGHAYEKAGNKEKAVENYMEVARADRSSGAGSDAEKRLSALAPERLRELPPPTGSFPP
jgi:predicted negative regulator of RcsB-dependent stress response